MTYFFLAALCLLGCTLLFILPPLLRRDNASPQQVGRAELNLAVLRDQLRELDADLAAGSIDRVAYDSARRELERRVIDETNPGNPALDGTPAARRTALIVALAVPLGAGVLYTLLGSPLSLQAADESSHAGAPQSVEAMVASLAQRLQNRPDDIEGWHMLARSYNALDRYQDASAAYAHLMTKTPDDPDLLADYADTLAMVRSRSLQGEPEKLIERALAIKPDHIKALALSGTAAYERKDYRLALARWQKIVDVSPADSEIAQSTLASMAQARSMMGAPAIANADSKPADTVKGGSTAKPAASGTRVAGKVTLDPSLRGKLADTDTVFIFARAAAGPRFPLAVLRKQVKDLPLEFVLDDSMAMMPEAKLSGFSRLIVGARISKTGSATASPGEPQAVVEDVQLGTDNLQLKITAAPN